MTGDHLTGQITREQAAVDAMYRRLDEELATARQALRQALAETADDPQQRYAREVTVGRLGRVIHERQAAERALCFGRIDTTDGESLHIGRIGLREPTGEILLVDWRADAARPFYAATAVAPLGLRRRRHLRLRERTVVGVSDELLDGSAPTDQDLVGDGPLREALDRARSGRMREAVATLQSEQDAIVRSPHRGVTVVQGGPGTGKTIVALHRAAYVLYAFPQVAERGVLVYGPNPRFLDYISDVLPSLGENDVRLATAADLVGVTPDTTDDPAVARLKGRAALATALGAWVRARRPHGRPLTVRIGPDRFTIAASTVDRLRRAALQDAPGHNPARARFREYLVDHLVDLLEQHTADTLDAFDAEVASVLGLDLDRMTAADLRNLGLEPVSAAEKPEFDREGVRADLRSDRGVEAAVERVWPRLRPDRVLREFLADRDGLRTLLPAWSDADIDRLARPATGLSAADLALLDEARELVDGPPQPVYGHIVVDEAQELSELEWRMLMRRCPGRFMTVVGDFAQAGGDSTVDSWEAALAPYVGDRFALHTLTVNYRTTAEILAAAAGLLTEIAPGQRPSRSIRHGEPPRTVTVAAAELTEAVAGLVAADQGAHPGQLTGVVCPPARVEPLQRRVAGTGAVVVAAPEARGLEFDAVVLVDPAGIRHHRPAGVRDLYVATTRATRRLVIVEVADGADG